MPRLARDLGVLIREDEALPVLRALLDAWQEDLRYRVSRVKARLEVHGRRLRARGDARRGRAAARLRAARLRARRRSTASPPTTSASQPQKQDRASLRSACPVHLGLISGDQMIARRRAGGELGGDVRVTRQQNLVLTGVADVEPSPRAALGRDRLPARREPAARRRRSPAPASRTATSPSPRRRRGCTGSSSTSRRRFGEEVAGLRLHLDGCPHACASTGSAISASRARPCATRRASAARPTTSACAARLGPRRRDRPSGVPPRADRGARRRRRAASSAPGSTRRERRTRASGVLRPHDRTTSSAP